MPNVTNRKILVLTENFPPIPGGSGRWFWELYSRLPSDSVLVVTNKEQYISTTEFDKKSPVKIVRTALFSKEWGLRSISGLKFYFNAVREIRSLVKQHEITEIHCGRVIHEGVVAWLLSRIHNIRYCCYVHGEDVETAATSREHNWMVKQVCKNAAYLICNSQNSADIVKRLKYAEREKVEILYPGVDSSTFIPSVSDQAFKAKMEWTGKFVILTVGRLQKRKGHHKMIEALSILKKENNDVLYVVVGSGDCRNSLINLAEKLELQSDVQFLSGLDDVDMIKCYQQCDLFLLPNITIGYDIEGFGMVLVEAQSCGKPVVAGDSGGTKETMLPSVTGEIIDCNDPEVLATHLSSLMKDSSRLKSMGERGREHVVANLDWEAHTKKANLIFNSYSN